MLAIYKRETKAFFQSVIGWLFIAVTLGLFGLYFYVYNLNYGSPYLSNTLSAITFIFLITVPILTMRVLSEERRSRTDQMILTAPISVGKVVIGKYLAMATVFSIPVAVMCLTPILLGRFGTVPYGECYVALLGYWLFGLTCIAIGTFISALTESQVIAAVLTFGVLFLGYMMQGIISLLSGASTIVTTILGCFDLASGMDDFLRGFLDVQALIYYISVILLFLFLTVQAIQKRRWSISSKKLKTGVFSTGFIAVALVAAVLVNLIGSQLPESIRAIDMTEQKLYSITKETENLLDSLEQDITIYVLASEENQDTLVQKTLERYSNYSSHIKVEYKDPSIYPSFYSNYTDTSVTWNSLIVVGDVTSRVIDYNSLYQTEIDYTTYSQTVTGYDAEGQLTSAISYVTSQDMPVIYQLTGHDELTLSDSFSDAVTKMNVTLQLLNLLECDAIPEDAAALIINSPGKDLSQDDVSKVLAYMEQGGKVLISTGYTQETLTNFHSVLEAYGVTITDGVIMEGNASNYYQRPYYLLLNPLYDEVTADVYGDYLFAPYAQSIEYTQDDSITYTELLTTSDSAYRKVDVENMQTMDQEDGDPAGSFVLGLHVSKVLEDEESTTELYVFSSDGIFTEEISQMVYGNNTTLFTGVLSQFVDSQVTSVVPAKSYEYSQLTINQAGVVSAGLVFTIAIPILLLAAGIVIWVRRRRK